MSYKTRSGREIMPERIYNDKVPFKPRRQGVLGRIRRKSRLRSGSG
jgi:hypothetical protein